MAIQSLTNTNISDTYVGVIHAGGAPLSASSIQLLYDGYGNASSLSIGRVDAGARITGSTVITGSTSITGNLTNTGVATSNSTVTGGITANGNIRVYEAIGTPASNTTGTLVLAHGNNGGASSIVFPSKTNTGGGDFAYIQYQDDETIGGTGEKSKLIIGIENDDNFPGSTMNDDIIIKSSGNVGINNNTPTYALDVTGTFRATGGASIGGTMYVGGVIYGSNDIVAYSTSDKNLKDNIQNITSPLDKISKINGVTFDWNSKQDTYTGSDVGVIAQEIEEVLPSIVTTRENGYKAVNYEKIVPLLIESIKELKLQNDNLKLDIADIQSKLK